MLGGHVSQSVTKKNLFWFFAVAIVVTFHSCAWLQYQQAKDDAEREPVVTRPAHTR